MDTHTVASLLNRWFGERRARQVRSELTSMASMPRLLVVFLLASAAYVVPAPVRACSVLFNPLDVRPFEDRGEPLDQLPANAIFYTHGGPPELGAAEMLGLEEDAAWSDRANAGLQDFGQTLTAFRIVDPDRFVDTSIELDACDSSSCEVVLGPIDAEPPSRPILDGLHVTLHRRAGGGGFSCPNVESMDFDVEVTDESTSAGHLHLLGWFGTDEAELAAATDPEIMFWPWPRDADSPAVNISLGLGGDHDRSGEHFRKGRYCFSLSAVDLAGNESDRSDPECIDTRDTDDPRVDFAGCGCTSTRDGSAPPWALPLLLLLWRRRLRQSRC